MKNEMKQMRMPLLTLAAACDRRGISNQAAAFIATAVQCNIRVKRTCLNAVG